MTIMAPVNIPAEPTPAMALPAIKVAELGATPQRSEPISKTKILLRKTLYAQKISHERFCSP